MEDDRDEVNGTRGNEAGSKDEAIRTNGNEQAGGVRLGTIGCKRN